MLFKIMILKVIFMLLGIIEAERARVWTRIPKFYVDNRIKYFLNENNIQNCFEFRETPTNLLLKCWRDNQLTDVSIEINPTTKKRRYFPISISI